MRGSPNGKQRTMRYCEGGGRASHEAPRRKCQAAPRERNRSGRRRQPRASADPADGDDVSAPSATRARGGARHLASASLSGVRDDRLPLFASSIMTHARGARCRQVQQRRVGNPSALPPTTPSYLSYDVIFPALEMKRIDNWMLDEGMK